MGDPQRRRRSAGGRRATGGPPSRGASRTARRAAPEPRSDTPPRPAAPSRPGAAGSPVPTGLTVGGVVHRGEVVGLDDSDPVLGLLDELVDARPSLVGTASLAAVLSLTVTREAVAGELVVRLFGGEFRPAAGAFGGPSGLRAVTATGCDVAFIGGRLVGTDVWVPTGARPGRLALLFAAARVYLVLGTDDDDEPQLRDPDRWVRLAALGDFDGVIDGARPPDPQPHPAAA